MLQVTSAPRRPRRPLFSLLSLAAALMLSAGAVAQKDEKKRDPDLPEQIKTFLQAISDKKFTRDAEAVQLVEQFAQRFPDLHQKDQKDILSALPKVFRAKPRKPDDPRLYEATITGLGTIGGETASKELVKAYGLSVFDDDEWLAIREKVLENIGRTKDERQIEFLIKEATRAPKDNLMRAAGHGLRHFAEAEGKTRKHIFNKLLIKYAQVEGNAGASIDTNNPSVATFRATLNAIQGPWNLTLSALSGANLRTAEQWQKWWNDNKNKRKVWK